MLKIEKFSGKLEQCIQQNEAEINWLDPPEVVKTLREVEELER
ncbi:unnamed protein product [Anisakis simplex]|uniref:DNA mismatch repair protein MutS n=1 Tax=Anisakis simplex TaxID=6269 RepID=A0A0M3JFI1_ANISI|nr:unnamed protein product [Anisakis simplex]